jgi:steroid 5-alpha reductase family enzyme
VRLTLNFYRGWRGLGAEDFRYADLRRRYGRFYWPLSFLGIHLMPTLVVYAGCLPLYAALVAAGGRPGWLDGAAAAFTLGAIGLAFAADEQLRRFRRDPATVGRCMRTGLWRASRHPNYLGEIAGWWGLFLFGLTAGGAWWWTLVGPLAITLLFVTVSIPLMERRMRATRQGYEEYRRCTPTLLPKRLGR